MGVQGLFKRGPERVTLFLCLLAAFAHLFCPDCSFILSIYTIGRVCFLENQHSEFMLLDNFLFNGVLKNIDGSLIPR